MNNGRTLSQLAAELERQVTSRKDFIAPQSAIQAVVVESPTTGAVVPEVVDASSDFDRLMKREVAIAGLPNSGPINITPFAHGQLSDHLGIPKKYYDRMAAEQPELLAMNINAWLAADPTNRRMLRTIDGRVRGILSPKFRALDNFELAQAVLPVLLQNNAQIVSSELTETRMYIKAILPALSDELPMGLAFGTGHNMIGQAGTDRGKLVAAITISNSDIGAGTLRVEPSVFTTWCTNLAIMQQAAMKKYHAGRANSADDATWEVFGDDTKRANDAAFWLQVRDITMAAFDEKMFRAAVASLRKTAENPIKSDDLPAVVATTIEQLALPQGVNNGLLKALAAGGDLTQWGLSSAITRVAGETADYETATQLERAGGQVLALGERDWSKIAAAVAA